MNRGDAVGQSAGSAQGRKSTGDRVTCDAEDRMRFEAFSFGTIRIDGLTHEHDVVIDRGQVRKRSEEPSRKFRHQFFHTHLSTQEDISSKCRTLVIQPNAECRFRQPLIFKA